MTDEFDEGLEAICVQAQTAWERLQHGVWGPHWDYSRSCLDYSRASLSRLSDWMVLSARGQGAADFKSLLVPAGQYFGETLLEHARAEWERRPDNTFGVAVHRADGEVHHVDIIEVFNAWIAAARGGKGAERPVLLDHFDRAVAGALPPYWSVR